MNMRPISKKKMNMQVNCITNLIGSFSHIKLNSFLLTNFQIKIEKADCTLSKSSCSLTHGRNIQNKHNHTPT
ncbi:hypothetical protein BRADI_2g12321v3 [Brachypodium distachyon]|uniref:Uncharacterized protein n=1 Tax=Brachypodium distachyon TaxID=15368 RepID=A0A2K2D842_BRADI|nr:hypothetical protein BRADI_2g12321v3 [Brachypodium distachyon]